jgi:hypothetical protein
VHCLALQAFLPGKAIRWTGIRTALNLVAGLTCLGAVAWFGQLLVQRMGLAGKLEDIVAIGVLIPLAAGAYFLVLWLLQHPALKSLARKA